MKVRAVLLGDSEGYKKHKEEFLRKHPEFKTEWEKIIGDPTKAYIELDTGGEFDYLSKKSQEALKKSLEIYLRKFGRLLMAAVNFDFSAYYSQGREMYGFRAIEAGLKEMVAAMRAGFPEEDLD